MDSQRTGISVPGLCCESESRMVTNALKAVGGKPEFTVYPEAGHDSWTETYNNESLYKWLLGQSLATRKK